MAQSHCASDRRTVGAGQAGGHWSSQISWPYINHWGRLCLPDYFFPPGVSDLPTALGRPQLASTIDTSQDESECLRGRRPPQHIDVLYQNLAWFQGRPEAALPCPALPCPVYLIDFSSFSINWSKGLFQRLQTKHCMYFNNYRIDKH